MDRLEVGSRGEPLVPALRVPDDAEYSFTVEGRRTSAHVNYSWGFRKISSRGRVLQSDAVVARLYCKANSFRFGHMSVHVQDNSDEEALKLRLAGSRIDSALIGRRWSFRVLPRGSKQNARALFTINRDSWGRGAMWKREAYRIYRGRERNRDMVYFCVGSYASHKWEVYRSEEDFDLYRRHVAEITHTPPPDSDTTEADTFAVTVKPGEDSALILALTVIIDMVNH